MNILNDSNFDESTKSGLVLVDFFAEWCGPCKRMEPILKEFDETSIRVVKVDCDESTATAKKFGVRSIPCLVFLNNGVEVARHNGLTKKETLLNTLDSLQKKD